MKKQLLRQKIKEERASLSESFVKEKSLEIEKNILKSKLYKEAKIIALYMPIKNEANVLGILKKSFEDEKRILIPVTQGEDIFFCETFRDTEFVSEDFGILVPKEKIKRENFLADIVFVPGIVFDRTGARIGWGRGFYDKLLKNTTSKKVGICYDFQVADEIETENHDIKMDYLITESELINCGEGL